MWTKAVTIWCDGEHCHSWEELQIETVTEARKELRGINWTYRDGQDLCPDCR